MLLKFNSIQDGMGPSESIVSVPTNDGVEEVAAYPGQLIDHALRVSPITEHNGNVLVELPSESFSGKWRVWVSRSNTESE